MPKSKVYLDDNVNVNEPVDLQTSNHKPNMSMSNNQHSPNNSIIFKLICQNRKQSEIIYVP